MSQKQFILWNAAAPTTAIMTSMSTTTSLKTLMQFKPVVNTIIIGWGFVHDTIPTAAVNMELITTGTVGGTGHTAYGANDLIKYGDSGNTASGIVTASVSGFGCTAEGSIVAPTRPLGKGPSWAASYDIQFPLDREAFVAAGDFCRIRALTTVAVSTLCYVIVQEP